MTNYCRYSSLRQACSAGAGAAAPGNLILKLNCLPILVAGDKAWNQ
jgi:hypothetical protein